MNNKYRKKPVVIEAVRWDGEMETMHALNDLGFVGGGALPGPLDIRTLEGTMRAEIGDWIIKGVKGEFYPCKPDIFEATYEAAA
jgi:hypothetical protein